MKPSYGLYLKTPRGEEEIVTGEKDPMRIHRIISGKSFSKRVSKFGCSAIITKNNRIMKLGDLERICLDLWFEQAEERNENS